MASVAPNSGDVPETYGENGINTPKELDAGVLFVLKSRGSWLHCGYQLTTAIVAPALLSLPFAFGLLGWVGGVVCLTMAALVTFYSYNLLSLVLDHNAQLGKRQLRDILVYLLALQAKWEFTTLPLRGNFGSPDACIGTNAIFPLLKAHQPHLLVLCLAYCACTTAGAIYIGYSKKAPMKEYSVTGVGINCIFGIFNAISIIATTYGSEIIPEIQATIAAPVTGKMFKGLLVCYAVVISTFFSIAISGYWAFGNQSQGSILQNFMVDGKPLVPRGFLLMTNAFTLLRVIAVVLTYLQPTNVVIECKFANPKKDQFSIRNVVPRLIFRSLFVVIATLLAAMLPFFGDIMVLFGPFGCIPLDFILPMIFYNVTFKPSKKSIIFWGNTFIATISTVLSLVGAVASVRQIVLDAKTYRLFANM
ncbi:hypothetical protein HYC85_014030 [Camellia sinensis]|uniref:Amino acid transporter transmembrane domain-containing protein n=1 Tax=Camellia sinensis TaxID=4442 RepID=A0A7J7H535_CAMSI|nr:hypothetical protein HYC85_014030 [Camellia sinensis]